MQVKRLNYRGWPNCYRLSNGVVDLIVTTDVGPRIIRFGFVGEKNEFFEDEKALGKRGGNQWRMYGGHRLWHAPEVEPRTYSPDNAPVKFEKRQGAVRLLQQVEPKTGIQKEMFLFLSPRHAQVTITHRLWNRNPWAIELAPWALSVMAPGGVAIIPLPPRGSHPKDLPPSSTLTLWAYTDLTDSRWTWGRQYALLRQDPRAPKPQKIGASVPDGWAAYARAGHLFVKKFNHFRDATYADFGSSVETFTNKDMLEVETLGPLVRVGPGEAVHHIEYWFLFRAVPVPSNDAEVDRHVLPKVRAARLPHS